MVPQNLLFIIRNEEKVRISFDSLALLLGILKKIFIILVLAVHTGTGL
jgi:hypothetical protein